MCHNKSSPPPPPNHDPHVNLRTTSRSMMKMIKEEEDAAIKALLKKKASVRPKRSSSGKSRSKRKKTKYLSLSSSRLSAPNDAVATAVESISSALDDGEYGGEVPSMTAVAATRRGRGHQLNLFPLHPEMKDEESDDDDGDENEDVAMLFESDGGATLHGLLMSSGNTASTLSSDRGDQAGAEESISYTNYGYNHRRRRDADDEILRTAMRGGRGDLSLEKWVCYSELVKEEIELTTTTTITTTPTTTTTTSSASTCCSVDGDRSRHHHQDQRLSLKLDYDEILNAWSDKGSFFIKTEDGESPPQTVPDLLQDELFQQVNDSSGNIENLWCVPDEGGSLKKSMQRQARVLRYKRKRETRLFAKRIRYEVRKLNAEKRPRMKGRFVKSS